jgi:hypothetical protein
MSAVYEPPAHVRANIAARRAAKTATTSCSGRGGHCEQPAIRRCARYGGAYCSSCWAGLPRTVTPTPDPDRTLAALRERGGMTVLSLAETCLDTKARDSGRRASGQQRRASHDEPARARDEALAAVDVRTDEWTRRTVDQALRDLARSGEPFSANDLRPLLPPGIPGPTIGARFQAAARAGLIRKTDRRVPSTDARTHAHEIAVWEAAA